MSSENPYPIDSQDWYDWQCRNDRRMRERDMLMQQAERVRRNREREVQKRLVQSLPTPERFRLAALRAIKEGRLRDHRLWAKAAGEAMWRNRHVPLVKRVPHD